MYFVSQHFLFFLSLGSEHHEKGGDYMFLTDSQKDALKNLLWLWYDLGHAPSFNDYDSDPRTGRANDEVGTPFGGYTRALSYGNIFYIDVEKRVATLGLLRDETDKDHLLQKKDASFDISKPGESTQISGLAKAKIAKYAPQAKPPEAPISPAPATTDVVSKKRGRKAHRNAERPKLAEEPTKEQETLLMPSQEPKKAIQEPKEVLEPQNLVEPQEPEEQPLNNKETAPESSNEYSEDNEYYLADDEYVAYEEYEETERVEIETEMETETVTRTESESEPKTESEPKPEIKSEPILEITPEPELEASEATVEEVSEVATEAIAENTNAAALEEATIQTDDDPEEDRESLTEEEKPMEKTHEPANMMMLSYLSRQIKLAASEEDYCLAVAGSPSKAILVQNTGKATVMKAEIPIEDVDTPIPAVTVFRRPVLAKNGVAVEDFPEPKEDRCYIVDREVADAANEAGRSTDDLFYPLEYTIVGKTIICKKLGRI